MMWEFWINRFQWGMVAKHSINPKIFYYTATLTAAQVTALPEEVDGKNRLESEQVLISNLYLCLGEKGQDELHKRRPHLDLSTVCYPRMIDILETEFKKERIETYETYQLLSRKQFINESLEQFHSVLSGLAARCNFGALEDRILRDVFIINMNNREAQKELCRSTKTPEEVYRIALSYERGNKYATSNFATGSLGSQGSSSGGGIQIKSEPVGTIRGGYRNNRARGRVSYQGRGTNRGGSLENWKNNRCYNCNRPYSNGRENTKTTGSEKYVSKTIKMQVRTTGLRVARPQNNINWNNSPGTENRTDRSNNSSRSWGQYIVSTSICQR